MTPLYDAIRTFAAQAPTRLHMPGHKGKTLPIPELAPAAALDFTELGPTGDLFSGGAPFDLAQQLWAARFGMEQALFLTGGSTMGLHTALALCAQPGEEVLVDRGCHRAVFHALALLDLHPVYLTRPWWENWNLTGPILPQEVETFLCAHPKIKTVCITSPTYCGLLSDIPAISHIVHRHGGKLVVDGAHGAHLPFLGVECFAGADVVVCSAHKTLPALGQSALLFANGFSPEQIRHTASIFGSSSPSYPMMISMDGARDWMEGPGREESLRVARRVSQLRRRFPCLDGEHLDPTRLTLMARDGNALARRLEGENLWPEMADHAHVVLILTGMDEERDLDRLEQVLERNRECLGEAPPLPPPPLPQQIRSPRQALFAPSHRIPLTQAEGHICAQQLAPYPPGVPVVAPGEKISQKELAYLDQIGYNSREVAVLTPTFQE